MPRGDSVAGAEARRCRRRRRRLIISRAAMRSGMAGGAMRASGQRFLLQKTAGSGTSTTNRQCSAITSHKCRQQRAAASIYASLLHMMPSVAMNWPPHKRDILPVGMS